MALISCPECKKQVSDAAEACPNCAYPIRKSSKAATQKKSKSLLVPIIIVGVVAIIVIPAMVGSIGKNDPAFAEQLKRKDAIKFCWEKQSRKSLSPEDQRLIAGACETMEGEYYKTYGVKP